MPWQEGERRGPFTLDFTGYGKATYDAARVTLAPRAADDVTRTHGTLITTTALYDDVRAEVRLTTTAQLRQRTAPNPWEVGWVLWAVRDPQHFYAVVLKPNGWEVSKQDPAYPGGQRFLASGSSPAFPVGQAHRVTLRHQSGTFSIWANDIPLARVTDHERPYDAGRVGLYTEDARVVVDRMMVARG